MQGSEIKAIFIIVNAGYADDVIDAVRAAGARGATILNARGEGKRHEVFMGITLDTEKEIILCLASASTADGIMAAVAEKAGIRTPAHGICFAVPVENTVGLDGLKSGT